MRAGFAEGDLAVLPRLGDEGGGAGAGVVGDDDGRTRLLREEEDAVGRLVFGEGWTRLAVVAPRRLPRLDERLGLRRDHRIVLAVDERHQPIAGRRPQQPQDRRIVGVVVGAVGRVELDARRPDIDQFRQIVLASRRQIGNHHVQRVIDDRGSGLLQTGLDRLAQPLPLELRGEVHHRRDAAERCRAAFGKPIVGRLVDTRVEPNVNVGIDHAGEDEETFGLDDLRAGRGRQPLTDGANLLPLRQQIGLPHPVRRYDRPSTDEDCSFVHH